MNFLSRRKTILLGMLLVCVGFGAFVISGEVPFQLDRANNVIRRWSCPPGGYVAGAGQQGNCVCKKCNPGYKCAGGYFGKRKCGRGRYQNVAGQNVCKQSPPGTFVGGLGATAPTQCNFGYYNNQWGRHWCTPASPGYHVNRQGARRQSRCSVGKHQNRRGQRHCQPVPPGTYGNKRGQTRGTPCPLGSYQNRGGQTSCNKASPGHYVHRRGQRTQFACRPNTYQHCSGQTLCIPCPVGQSSVQGSTRCRFLPQLPPRGVWRAVFECDRNVFRQVTPMTALRQQMASNPRVQLRFAIPGNMGNSAYTVTSRVNPRGYPNVVSNFKKMRILNNYVDGGRKRSWTNFHTDNWVGTSTALSRFWYSCANPYMFRVNSGSKYDNAYWACNNSNGIHVLNNMRNWVARAGTAADPPIGLYYRIL